MIELKVKGNEVSVVVGEDDEGFLTECTVAIHAWLVQYPKKKE